MKRLNVLTVFSLSILSLASCKKESTAINPEVAGQSRVSKSFEETTGPGAVYLLDNAAAGNHVLAYSRSASGQLSSAGSFPTGGMGTGAGLGSQGAVILDNSNQYLYAVNAGSNEISSFRISGEELTWVDKISSGGTMPISLTIHNDVLYVLNAGGMGNIHGFRVNDGHLTGITGSNQSLSTGAAGPAQIQFNNEGTQLVVTEKATNTIDVYPVANGVAGIRISYPSVGDTPFGFAFGNSGELIIADAFGGMPGLSALTSYSLNNMGDLNLISGPIGTTQTAACWVVITNSGRFAYTSNTGSASISGYSISNDGVITMLNSNGVTGSTGTSPSDMALNNNSHFLYARNGDSNSITMFEVGASGTLSSLGTVSGLPSGSVGLAAK